MEKSLDQQVVPDIEDEIVRGLEIAYTYADVVLTIGGLGPTVDDLTRNGVAKYFKLELVYDESVYKGICDYILVVLINQYLVIIFVRRIDLKKDLFYLIGMEQHRDYF